MEHPTKEIFSEHGITQARIAKQLNLSQAAVCYYFSGKRAVPADINKQLNKMARFVKRKSINPFHGLKL